MLARLLAAVMLFGPVNVAMSGCGLTDLFRDECITGSLNNNQAELDGTTGIGGQNTPGNPSTDPDPDPLCQSLRGCEFSITSPLSLSDIAAFRPEAAARNMQPKGWAVVGVDANFYSSGASHIVDGTLLGQPASVRFTPIGWHWEYGDGSAKDASGPGGTWAQLGVREFEPTPGSHVFRTKGTYVVSLTVDFRAEYRYAGWPWVSIPGTLALASAPLTVTTVSVRTVLVNESCAANPRGPGC